MGKLDEAKDILSAVGMPVAQQNDMAALTLLALVLVMPDDLWTSASRTSQTVTKSIMKFVAAHYGRRYAPNTRETFRRQVLHQFVQAGIADYNPDNPDLPTNSPHAHYAISTEMLKLVQHYGTHGWKRALSRFRKLQGHQKTSERGHRRAAQSVRRVDGSIVRLSPGAHSKLQIAVLEEFAPRFASEAELLYLGDTADKMLIVESARLEEIGLKLSSHAKLPDVILYASAPRWLYLIEAVTSHGPISPKRLIELKAMVAEIEVGCIYVTAFPTSAVFRSHARDIAWETEVWIADMPEHMIHFNGDRFLGPR